MVESMFLLQEQAVRQHGLEELLHVLVDDVGASQQHGAAPCGLYEAQ